MMGSPGFSLIVPAAGLGTRMGTDVPKALIPVQGRPLVEWIMRPFASAASEVLFVVRPDQADRFQTTHFRELSPGQPQLTFQESPTGTAHAVLLGLRASHHEWAIVIWADHIGAARFPLSSLWPPDPLVDLAIPVVERSDPYAFFEVDAKGQPTKFHETRSGARRVSSGLNDCGVFLIRRGSILHALDQLHVESRPTETNFLALFPDFVRAGLRVNCMSLSDVGLTIGANTLDELARAVRQLEIGAP